MSKFGPCPECGQVISRDLGRCPYCRTELAPGAIEETAAGATAEAGRRTWQPRRLRFEEAPAPAAPPVETRPAPPPPPPAPPVKPERYLPTASLGLALQLMFLAWMGLGGLNAAAWFVQWRLLDRLVANPFAVSYQQAAAADDRSFRLGLVAIAAYIVTGMLFIAWLHRSYRNLTAFTGRPTRFTGGWAIGAWFVPFLNLIRPKQIVDECWLESGPGRDPAVPYRYRTGSRVPALLHIWWGLMIAGRVFGFSFWVNAGPETLRFWAMWLAIGAVLETGAAAAAFWVVTLLTRRQATQSQRLGLDRAPRKVSRPVVVVLAAALPLAAAGTAVPAFLAWDEPAAFAVISGINAGQEQHYDAYGVGFRYPAGYLAAESSGFGSGRPTYMHGMVALTPEDPARQDRYLVVEWATGPTTADAAVLIDSVVDMITWTESGSPLIRTSELINLDFGTGDLVARTFSAGEGRAWISGAVGYGMCPSSDRLVGIRYVYPYTNRQGAALDDLEALLATLHC